MPKGELCPLQLDQIMYIKLILSSLAKERGNLRELVASDPSLEPLISDITNDCLDLLFSIKTNHFPNNLAKKVALIGNFS